MFTCSVASPRVVADTLSAIHLKRGQTAICAATRSLGLQFSVEMSNCLQAKVTLKENLFDSFDLVEDVQV